MHTAEPLQLFTVADVAALMRHSPGWVRKQYRSGALNYLRDGRSIRFRRADIEAFQASLGPHTKPQLAQVIDLHRDAA
jgi:excisionase family DNA binding protein